MSVRVDLLDVDTADGPARLRLDAPAGPPRAVLALGHGAGGGIDALDLAALAGELPARGVAVARVEQPWRVAGRRVAGPPASLDRGWRAALTALADRLPSVPLLIGGRSAGARVACRCFAAPALGVVALSFPLHPPGRPERSRAGELAAVPAPVLLVSGDRDPFGSPSELADAAASGGVGERTLVLVPGCAHSFKERRGEPGQPGRSIVDAVAAFVDALVGGPPSGR